MDGISILMEGTTYGASFGTNTQILTESAGASKKTLVAKIVAALVAAFAAVTIAVKKLNDRKVELAFGEISDSDSVEPDAYKGFVGFFKKAIDSAQGKVQDEIAKAKSAKVEADKIKAAEQVADSFFGKVAKPFLFAFEKGETALTKVKELATKLKTTYKDAGAKFKLAEGVASVLAAYSIGYGLLKTVKEISVDSFLSVKSNVQKMISVISNPKTYGWAKAGGLVLITLLAAHGMYRFGSVVVSFIKSKFNKDGKAEA